MSTLAETVTELRGVTVWPSNSMPWFSVVVVTLPVAWSSVAARAWRISPSARRIPAAAAVTVGLFSCARRIASAKVTLTVGEGSVCAPAGSAHTLSATATETLDHHIQDRNERKVEERRRDHAAGHRGA